MTKLKLRIENVEKNNERDVADLGERGKVQEEEIQRLAKL